MPERHYRVERVEKGTLGKVQPLQGGTIWVSINRDNETVMSFFIAGSDLCCRNNSAAARLLKLLEGRPTEVGCLNNGTFVELRIEGVEIVRARPPQPRSLWQRIFG